MVATVSIKDTARVLVLEDDSYRIDWFKMKLPSRTVFVKTAEEAKEAIHKNGSFDAYFLDHDLGPDDYAAYERGEPKTTGNGTEVAEFLKKRGVDGSMVIIHSFNFPAADRMMGILEGVSIALPFGSFNIRIVK